ncbi:MAG: hypothetical protein AAB577_01670 [Patescibacteria group bacterium]
MKTKNLTIAAIVAVVAIVGLLNIANAVPGAGRSGNPPDVEPATTFQDLVNCCQNRATNAEYQDNAATNQVMGTCTKAGIETFRTGGLPALQSYINNTACGACETNAAGLVCGEDDGNDCTIGFCSTGLRPGCITAIAVDGTSCQIDGQLGVCSGATCVPSEETCITREEGCGEEGGWSVVPTELCESGFACGIAAEYECMCPFE